MKIIPVCINGNRNHTIDFELKRMATDRFNISTDCANGPVLSFYFDDRPNGRHNNETNGVVLQSGRGQQIYHIAEVKADNEHDCQNITISLKKEKSGELKFKTDHFSFDFDKNELRYTEIDKTRTLIVTINFVDYERHSVDLIFHLSTSAHFRDVVIDSGSEAIQIAMHKRGGNYSVNSKEPLIYSTIQHYGRASEDPISFTQADSQNGICNAHLCRRNIFAKKKITQAELENGVTKFSTDDTEDENSIMRRVTTANDLEKIKDSHLTLPNLKVSSFGGVVLPDIIYDGLPVCVTDVPNNFYNRLFTNFYLYLILQRFCHPQNQKTEGNEAHLLSLHVLMPNVYSYSKVQETLDYISRDLENMINVNKLSNTIMGFEVKAISESDASLVGAYSFTRGRHFPDGKYIVFDNGNGTNDFSVVEIYNNGTVKNILRSGIVGASAAISYGFILDLICEFSRVTGISSQPSDNELRAFVRDTIMGLTKEGKDNEGGDVFHLNNLMKEVNDYKIRFKTLSAPKPETTVSQNGDSLSSIKLSTFTGWIKSCNYAIDTPYVDAIIDTIIDYSLTKIVGCTDITDIQYVVFAGRGFLFDKLREQMFKSISDLKSELLKSASNEDKSKSANIEECVFLHSDDGTNMKDVCLYVTEAIYKGRYDHQSLPIPYQIDASLISDLEKRTTTEVPETPIVSWKDRLKQKAKKAILKKVNQTTEQVPTNLDNPFAVGHKIQSAPNIYVAIGGTFYQLPSDAPVGQASIFYSNGRIYIRYENKSRCELLTPQSDIATGLAFPSLFPNCCVHNWTEIYIPKITPKNNEKKEAPQKTHTSEKTSTPDTTPSSSEDNDNVLNELDKLLDI